MSDTLQIPRKHINTALTLSLTLLLLNTAITTTATTYTTPQRTLYTWGTATNPQTIGTTTQFTLTQGNQTLGTATLQHRVETGDTVAWYNAEDSTNIPYLYTPRAWSEVYVNNELIQTSIQQPNIITQIIPYLALLTIYIMANRWKR